MVDYFGSLFSSRGTLSIYSIIDVVPSVVTHQMNALLYSSNTLDEVFQTLSQMHTRKAPRQDRMNPCFCQRFWLVVGMMSQGQFAILNGGSFPPAFNHTHVALIPKKHNLNKVCDSRPISLYNVIYKLVTNVISNMLKSCLKLVITENQGAFVHDHMITYNILVSNEVFRDMKLRPRADGGMDLELTCLSLLTELNDLFLGPLC